jgi:beta-glucuronidase
MTEAEYDTELGGMAAIGVNLIRNSVYTRHPYVYDWADRHGMMVLDDCDNMWLNLPQQKLQTSTYGQSRAVATMMAWHQVNHPSVVMWRLQNESEVDNVTYRAWLADMKQAVRRADPQHRPVTWASSTSWDPAFDLADVVGTEEWQAEKFRRHWAQVVVRDQVCGYTFWVYKDYKQRRGYNQEYNGISVMGLMDFTEGSRRLVHQAYAEALSPPR